MPIINDIEYSYSDDLERKIDRELVESAMAEALGILVINSVED
jgi:hypothetical protein